MFGPDEEYPVPFQQAYEVMRVARACDMPFTAFTELFQQSTDDYERLWMSLTAIAKEHKRNMPERSRPAAWKKAATDFSCVGLSGDLKFSSRPGQPLFDFKLKPLQVQSSYRLSRKYGGDRFCVITMPAIEPNDLPTYLKDFHSAFRLALITWLGDTDHFFLGRTWRAFYCKPESGKKSEGRGQKLLAKTGFRIFFFAVDGKGFQQGLPRGELDPRKLNHITTTLPKMISWFMPAKENQKQPCLKSFARLALAVSSTRPTIVFTPTEIIRSDDAYADTPAPRRLNLKRSDEKKKHLHPVDSRGRKVMNDGCARISKAAAKGIAEELHLDTVPSCFQGRIGGAKGMWMVDVLDERLPGKNRGYWIEITDSQLKFEGDPMDNLYPDHGRVTFEVQSWSRKLSAAQLNFQLMPILADRGVPCDVFERLLQEDLTAKVGELEVAMDSPLALLRWNQDNNPVTEERVNNNGIAMLGGIPDSLSEKIGWFVGVSTSAQIPYVIVYTH